MCLVDEIFKPELADYRLSLSERCRNAKELAIGLKNTEAFFTNPKPELEKLIFRTCASGPEEDDILCVAKNSGGLREITLRGPRVTVYFNDLCPVCMNDLIDCFMDCHFLKEISMGTEGRIADVTWQTSVADKCLLLRRRNVSISIGDIYYLR